MATEREIEHVALKLGCTPVSLRKALDALDTEEQVQLCLGLEIDPESFAFNLWEYRRKVNTNQRAMEAFRSRRIQR